jgi:hypothetical protein
MKRILEYTPSATRLIDFFYKSFITSFDNKNSNETYDIIFIGSNQLNDCNDILQYATNETKFYIDSTTESSGFYGVYENTLNFKKRFNIPYDNVILICDVISDNDFNKLSDLKVFNSKYFPFYAYLTFTHDSFSVFNGHQLQMMENLPYKSYRNKLYVSRNGRFNEFRAYTLYYLFKNRLINEGIISAFFYGSNKTIHKDFNDITYFNQFMDKEYWDSVVASKFPIKIDNFFLGWDENENADISGELHHTDIFSNGYIDLVTENINYIPKKFEYNTLTEKSLKPFLFYQLPIFISYSNNLQCLRTMGFDLFDDILDNSYDLIEDPKERIDVALSNLTKLKNIDLSDYFKLHKHRFINNRNLIFKLAFSDGLNDVFRFINFLNI